MHARGEQARFQSEVQRYETMQTQYNQIKAIAQQAGLLPPERTAAPPQSSVLQPPPARQAGPAYGTHSQRVQQAQAYQRPQQQLQQQQLVQNQQQQLQQRLAQMRQRQEQFREQVQQQYGRGQGLRPPQQPIQQQQQQQDQRLAAFMASKRQAQPGASGFKSFNGILEQEAAQLLSNAGYTGPPTVQVTCQGVNGTMLVAEQRVMCECSGCIRLPAAQRTMTCTQFENHAGMGTAKKWKHSLRVLPGSQRDVPVHGPPISIGRWLEARGVNVDKLPFRSTPTGAVPVSRDVQAPPSGQAPPPAHRSFGTAFAPWSGQKEAPGPSSAFQPALAQRQQQHPALPHTHPRAAAAHQAAADGHGYGRGGRGGYEEMLAVDDDRDPMYAPRTTSHAHQSVGSGRGRGGGRAGRGGDAQRNLTGRGWGAAMASASGPPAAGNKAAGVQQHYTPWRDANEGKFTPINVRWSGERCSVCDVDTDYDHDQLITCDMCGITVHQSCYGVQEVPGVEDMWLCRACELREEGRPLPQCCLCPVAGGALKPTNISGLWCHAACLQWIPEVTVDDVDKMEPVRGIRSIQRERWELLCMLCKQRMGAKIQCHTCYAAYHPLCGRLAGLHMEIIDTGQVGEAVQNISYCPKHRPPQPQLSGMQTFSASAPLCPCCYCDKSPA